MWPGWFVSTYLIACLVIVITNQFSSPGRAVGQVCVSVCRQQLLK